jgi:hypothetical protein
MARGDGLCFVFGILFSARIQLRPLSIGLSKCASDAQDAPPLTKIPTLAQETRKAGALSELF